MAAKRTNAIAGEIDRSNQAGVSKYFYVNQSKLDRLGITQFRPAKGNNFVRIIPPKDPTQFYGKTVYIHSNIGADGATYLCPLRTFDRPCPICEQRQRIRDKDPDSELLSALASRPRELFFVYDVTSVETIEKGLRWWDAPMVIKDNIVTLSKDRRTGEIIDVSDLNDGKDIEFVKVGSHLKTKYEGCKLVDAKPVPEKWATDVPEFDNVLMEQSYDRLKKDLTGDADSQDPAPSEEVEVVDEGEVEERARTRGGTRTPEATSKPPEDKKPVETKESDVKAKLDEIRNRRSQEK